jgi:hypothetical protein
MLSLLIDESMVGERRARFKLVLEKYVLVGRGSFGSNRAIKSDER